MILRNPAKLEILRVFYPCFSQFLPQKPLQIGQNPKVQTKKLSDAEFLIQITQSKSTFRLIHHFLFQHLLM